MEEVIAKLCDIENEMTSTREVLKEIRDHLHVIAASLDSMKHLRLISETLQDTLNHIANHMPT